MNLLSRLLRRITSGLFGRGLIATSQRIELLLGFSPHLVRIFTVAFAELDAGLCSFSLDILGFSHYFWCSS